jgi:phage replication-related protein YjqB (UPF0714/DUF867 family)
MRSRASYARKWLKREGDFKESRAMSDLYDCFAALAENETEEIHYRIRATMKPSPVVIVAPHGGWIERGTSEIAAEIAGDKFSLYCFESLERRSKGAGLHITSTRFDEPQAVRLVEASEVAVGVHGRKNRDDEMSVWVGGLNECLRDAIRDSLEQSGFKAKAIGDGHRLSGRDATNICNRGRRGAGVQLELPLALRLRIISDDPLRQDFGAAIREAIETGYCDAFQSSTRSGLVQGDCGAN